MKPHTAIDYENMLGEGVDGSPEEWNCYCPIGHDHDIAEGLVRDDPDDTP